ncbi:MAG: TonB-dependent receptor [Flavobacteriaceae bacterium]|nr:TonB-dependent receptor [Flavobacteriaceae bacterium]
MKTYSIILILLGCISLNAQNSISGIITDEDKTPLFGVEVYITQLHKGASTNNEGSFKLDNVPNGTFKVSFSYLGYKTVVRTITLNNSKETITLVLKEAVFEVDEIIISTPFNKLQSENVLKVDRITAKSIQKTGAATLIQGLENVPGVSQISTGSGIGKPVIRGLSGNRVLVYTQGIRLENQQFGDEHGLGINAAGIESIEIIKGPASLLYGSDALGGVLYINSERFASSHKTQSSFNQQYFSNTLGSNSSFGFKTSTENWKFLIRGTYAAHSDYKTPTRQRVTNTRFNERDLKAGIGFNKNSFSSEIRYNFNRSKLGLTEGIDIQSSSKSILEPYQLIDNHILSLHNHIFFGNSKLDIDLGYTFNNRNEFEEHDEHVGVPDHDEEKAALQIDLKTFTYNVKHHFSTPGKVSVILGVQGISQTNRNFGEELLIPNANINDFGTFITLNHQWNENSIQAGIRYDNRSITTERHEVIHGVDLHIFEAINKSYTSITTSLGYKTTLFQNIITRINIASGFRAPNLAELTSNGIHHGTNRFEIGNSNLKNEKNSQLDLSLEYKTDHIEFFANGFYNKINDYIFITPTGAIEDGIPVFTYIQEDAQLFGGEFGFHWHPHPLDWLHLESSYEIVIGEQENGNPLPLIPANVWKNTFRVELDNGSWLTQGYTSVSLQSFFQQNRVTNFETPTDGYHLFNVGLGGAIQIASLKFNTSVSINNLFDTKYTNHLSRLKANAILNQGRNIVIGLTFII